MPHDTDLYSVLAGATDGGSLAPTGFIRSMCRIPELSAPHFEGGVGVLNSNDSGTLHGDSRGASFKHHKT